MTEKLRKLSLYLGPASAVLTCALMLSSGWPLLASLTGGLTLLCALWWVFEPIPIPVTSMIPLGIFPMLGILNGTQVAAAYGHPLIILLMGGAMLSKAMEKSGAHRRVALGMVNLFGGDNPRRMVMGFMVASAVLSMWISNTATVLMLMPVAMAVLEKSNDRGLVLPLLLGIAYGASIGGMGTLIGTPPNVIFLENYRQVTGVEPTFVGWMLWALPVVAVFIPVAAYWLTRKLPRTQSLTLPNQGEWRSEERRVLWIFLGTAMAWATLKEPFGGWSGWLNLPTVNYASVALAAVLLMFLVPSGNPHKNSDKGSDRLLDWETASSIQWGVLLLFAGGIAIAKAFALNGLSEAIGQHLAGLTSWSPFVMILCVALGVTFLTEVTSNTATTVLLMPILGAAATASQIDPLLLMLPAAFSASCAFMLPVATAPNAIIFGSGMVSVEEMAREGLVLNLLGAAIISVICYLLLV